MLCWVSNFSFLNYQLIEPELISDEVTEVRKWNLIHRQIARRLTKLQSLIVFVRGSLQV